VGKDVWVLPTGGRGMDGGERKCFPSASGEDQRLAIDGELDIADVGGAVGVHQGAERRCRGVMRKNCGEGEEVWEGSGGGSDGCCEQRESSKELHVGVFSACGAV